MLILPLEHFLLCHEMLTHHKADRLTDLFSMICRLLCFHSKNFFAKSVSRNALLFLMMFLELTSYIRFVFVFFHFMLFLTFPKLFVRML